MEHRSVPTVASKSFRAGEERGFDRLILRLAIILSAASVAVYGIYVLQNLHAARKAPALAGCRYSDLAAYAICGKTAGTGTTGLSDCERLGKSWVCRVVPSPRDESAYTLKKLGF